MSVATKARALVSMAAAAVGVADVEALAKQAADDLAAAEAALEEADARLGFGEGNAADVEAKRAERDKKKRASEQANAMLNVVRIRDKQKAEKAETDRENAAWIDAKRYADERVALVERYVADCKRIEETVCKLITVGHRLDEVSPRRKDSSDLRGMIVGKGMADRLMAIMRGLIPSLHRQPGMQPHEKGVEHFIASELGWSRVFGDRNFKQGE